MDKRDLLLLDQAANLTPAEIQRRQPALFKKMGEQAGEDLKKNALATVKHSPKNIRDFVAKLDFSPAKIGKNNVKVLMAKSLNIARIPAPQKKEIQDVMAVLPEMGTLDDILQPEMPVLVNPAFHRDLAVAKVHRLSDIAGIPQAKAEKAIAADFDLNAANDEKLGELVRRRVMTNKEAQALGLAANLYTLFDSSFELTAHVKVKSMEELVAFDEQDWKRHIEESRTPLPDDIPAEDYAHILRKKVELLFPDRSLAARAASGGDNLIQRFAKNNPGVNFLTINYRHDSGDVKKLNFQGFNPNQRQQVMTSIKSYQRVYSITQDVEHTESIVKAGFPSAFHITASTLEEFTKATKLSANLAFKYFKNAHDSIVKTTGVIGSILDLLTGSFDWTRVGNTGPSVKDYLREIPGYDDLFGDLAFCDCQWCSSIHSPAAYFVDLMQFVEKYVIKKHFSGGQANHVLNIKVRRPDLWTLPVTCEHTLALVPYLDIINEILTIYIARQKGFTGDFDDMAAVEDFVFQREIALEKPGNWKTGVHSFSQPFHLPSVSLSTYLGHFERTRQQVAKLLGSPRQQVSAAKLELTEKELKLITTPDAGQAFLTRVYGMSFPLAAGKVKPFDAQLLLQPLGMERDELGRLLKTDFVTLHGAENIVIKGEKKDSSSIQNDIERVHDLTLAALDRMHRFVRLLRKTPWTIGELDMVVEQLQTANLATGIDGAAVTEIGGLLALQEALEVSAAQLCAMWGTLPAELLDSLFNHADAVAAEGAYPKSTVLFIHPALAIDRSTPGAEFSSSRLMAGLNRSDAEVLVLIQHLKQPLGIVDIASATESQRGFNLTLANLTLLYRHSKLAEVLKLTIPQLFQLLNVGGGLGNNFIQNTADVEALLEMFGWWKASGFTLDQLHFMIKSGNVLAPETFPSKDGIVQFILDRTAAEQALLFADTVFAYFDDITEEQSRAIVAANSAVMEPAPDGVNFRLKPAFAPGSPITVPQGVTRAETDLRQLLTDYHPQTLIPHFLAGRLGLDNGQITALIDALGVDLDNDAFALELQGQGAPTAIGQLVDKLIPLSVLFKDEAFDHDVMTYILSHLNLFGIANLDTVTIPNVRRLKLFAGFLTKQPDGTFNIDLLETVIGAFDAAQQFKQADQEQLAAVLNTDSGSLASLHPLLQGSSQPIDTLGRLAQLVEITSYLGIGGDVLPLMVSNGYDDLKQASAAVLSAFMTKYASQEERKEKLEPYQDALRGKKRRALTDYLIHSGFPQFRSESDLFHYFLIDTELEGCARTSRLVAATMSLQLYIHRILLNLEQDDKAPGTSGKVHVKADDIPGDEWVWRKNYRVWEANRKVFLYPENYIEPELRDNKTPLFEELESELLQQEVNGDTVLEAYAKYMRGFDEVAHLKIAGSFHEADEKTGTDVLHLFGVTADEPPLYYYRTVENLHAGEGDDNRGVVWGAWQKLNVQIPVRHVAPILFNGRLHVFWARVTTLAKTVFDNNRSIFTGYDHKYAIEFTTLKLDGTWTPPQKLDLFPQSPFERTPFSGNGVIQDPLAEDAEIKALQESIHEALRSFPFFKFSNLSQEIRDLKTPRYDVKPHYEPIDEYTLGGFMWDRVYPSTNQNRLILYAAGYQMRAAIDFYNLSVRNVGFASGKWREARTINFKTPGKILMYHGNKLFRGQSPKAILFDNYAYCALVVNTIKSDPMLQRHWEPHGLNLFFDNVEQEQIATFAAGTTVAVVNGAFADGIVDVLGDLLLVRGTGIEGDGFFLERIGTTLSETLTRTLFTSGVDTMLDIETQKKLKEAPAPITITQNRVVNNVAKDKIDFGGAYGTYYREIFFHIPFLLANHLNSQGKFAEAQKWYHYIFNPSATEVVTTPDQELDRNWQYIEFREIDAQKLRDQLSDKQAIEVYKKDPFNPHAIARLRMSAYQKSIVMKYIDNLLDWGDHLFARDTMESINEATLLYVMAQEILGSRPAQLGDCGEGKVKPKTYEKISPLLSAGSEFLAELEHYTYRRKIFPRKAKSLFALDAGLLHEMSKVTAVKVKAGKGVNYQPMVAGNITLVQANMIAAFNKKQEKDIPIKPVDDAKTSQFARGTVRVLDWKKDTFYGPHFFKLPSFGISVLSHVSPVFCVPGNKDLLRYWDRVEDRLFKIRNCMNIKGKRRQLALFAPEIDPRLLVRARAAGLSLDDILNSLSGNLPPYRFSYIIERAKAYAAMVQSFGSSLLSALEKKDGEELTQLRMTHQHNILEMTSKSRKLEIDNANEGIKALNDRITSLKYQVGYYDGLISQNLTGWEMLQAASRHTATIVRLISGTFWATSGIMNLLPQLGSPFAMKYGGVELGGSTGKWAEFSKTLSDLALNVAASAGLEAGFERRKQGWQHQKKLVEFELKQAEKNLTAAEIKRDILIEAEKIHQKNIEQSSEIMEMYGEKFSNLGLFTFLSSTLQRLFREAYNNAYAIAKLAEQAFRFERDDNTIYIEGNYFDSSRAGLLAGERLRMGLQAMERRYLETNYRKNEIDQAFSLTQLNPAALLVLKQTGTCEFTIPELFFDLFYPGHYQRKIQSVRLTIPSVTGPYTNVSANLSLSRSFIRMEAKLGAAELKELPKSRTTNIATSTAQNDAGVFQLNFKDDRYMPFEGAGAVSSWKLSLPKHFRQFDYDTINDVIVHISYTAEYDELLRDKVEAQNDTIEGTIVNFLKNNPLSRTFSFRQEFSTAFSRLIHQPPNQPVSIKIENKHFPLFMNGKPISITTAKLVLLTPQNQTVANLDITLNNASQTNFTKDPTLGNLFTKDLGNLFNTGILGHHTITITNPGDLAPTTPTPGAPQALDPEKLPDIILYLQYKLT